MTRYTQNFTIEEFASRDGREPEARMAHDFMAMLQILRIAIGRPLVVNSGIRSKEHNQAVNGSPTSQHLLRPCSAVDISLKGFSAANRHLILSLVFDMKFRGVGIGKDFLHLDMRKGPEVCWFY